MDRYWKCVMTNDSNDFKVGKIYITEEDGTSFEDDTGYYYSEVHIENLNVAEFEEVKVKRSCDEDRYWKCIKTNGDWFKKNKIYVTDLNGENVVNEQGYKLNTKMPVDFIPVYKFEEVSHEDWMEQKYKAYYEEEEKMKNKRYWKCIQSDRSDFTEGKVYKTDSNKLNFADDDNYTWRREIDEVNDALFREITEDEYLNMNEENTCDKTFQLSNNSKCVVNDSDRHMEICTNLNETFKKKNSDYGNSFSKSYEIFGLVGATSRIYDKMNRLLSLTIESKEREVEDEPIEDTLLDMANYCILTYMELTRKEGK